MVDDNLNDAILVSIFQTTDDFVMLFGDALAVLGFIAAVFKDAQKGDIRKSLGLHAYGMVCFLQESVFAGLC